MVMTGLSGTGKSTVAKRLARALGARWLRTDEIRAGLTDVASAASGAWRGGAFAPEWTARTYDELFRLAREAMTSGLPVVLDGAFVDPALRDRAAREAGAAGIPALLLETTASEAVVRDRLLARERSRSDPSRATYATYLRQREAVSAAPPGVPPGMHHAVVDTSGPAATTLDPVWRMLTGLDLVGSGL
jgi:predicted kinase